LIDNLFLSFRIVQAIYPLPFILEISELLENVKDKGSKNKKNYMEEVMKRKRVNKKKLRK